jgi:hypothetical protein
VSTDFLRRPTHADIRAAVSWQFLINSNVIANGNGTGNMIMPMRPMNGTMPKMNMTMPKMNMTMSMTKEQWHAAGHQFPGRN